MGRIFEGYEKKWRHLAHFSSLSTAKVAKLELCRLGSEKKYGDLKIDASTPVLVRGGGALKPSSYPS